MYLFRLDIIFPCDALAPHSDAKAIPRTTNYTQEVEADHANILSESSPHPMHGRFTMHSVLLAIVPEVTALHHLLQHLSALLSVRLPYSSFVGNMNTSFSTH